MRIDSLQLEESLEILIASLRKENRIKLVDLYSSILKLLRAAQTDSDVLQILRSIPPASITSYGDIGVNQESLVYTVLDRMSELEAKLSRV